MFEGRFRIVCAPGPINKGHISIALAARWNVGISMGERPGYEVERGKSVGCAAKLYLPHTQDVLVDYSAFRWGAQWRRGSLRDAAWCRIGSSLGLCGGDEGTNLGDSCYVPAYEPVNFVSIPVLIEREKQYWRC